MGMWVGQLAFTSLITHEPPSLSFEVCTPSLETIALD